MADEPEDLEPEEDAEAEEDAEDLDEDATVEDEVDPSDLMDLLEAMSPDAQVTGFVLVVERIDADGNRYLNTLKPGSSPPWEVQGWLLNALTDAMWSE